MSNPSAIHVALAGTTRRRKDVEVHRFRDQAPDTLRRLDKVRIVKVGVARGGPVPPVTQQPSHQGVVEKARQS
ncbi:MAG: hypothetical protein OXL41_02465 [Nitrospinae bacterium]|nr:hypothetical protein [Nitrospinota bacterium]